VEHGYRANKLRFDDTTIKDTVRNQHHLAHLDFVPSAVSSLAIDQTVLNTMEETER